MATGNGYEMGLLLPRTNTDAPAPQHRRRRRSGQRVQQACLERRRAAHLSSPTWAEASVPQPDAVVEDLFIAESSSGADNGGHI
jgi:hypothetical protein